METSNDNGVNLSSAKAKLQKILNDSELDPEWPFPTETFIGILQAHPELAHEPLSSSSSSKWSQLPFQFLCLMSEDDVPNPPTLAMLEQVYQLYPEAISSSSSSSQENNHSLLHTVVACNPRVDLVDYLIQHDKQNSAVRTLSPEGIWPIHLLVRDNFIESDLAMVLAQAFPESIRTPCGPLHLSIIQLVIDAREMLRNDEQGLQDNEATILALIDIDPNACQVMDYNPNHTSLLPLGELLTGPVTPQLVEAVIKSWPQALVHLNDGYFDKKQWLPNNIKEVLKRYCTGDNFENNFGSVDDANYTESDVEN